MNAILFTYPFLDLFIMINKALSLLKITLLKVTLLKVTVTRQILLTKQALQKIPKPLADHHLK